MRRCQWSDTHINEFVELAIRREYKELEELAKDMRDDFQEENRKLALAVAQLTLEKAELEREIVAMHAVTGA